MRGEGRSEFIPPSARNSSLAKNFVFAFKNLPFRLFPNGNKWERFHYIYIHIYMMKAARRKGGGMKKTKQNKPNKPTNKPTKTTKTEGGEASLKQKKMGAPPCCR
nr:hypothetical protein [Morchella crassipes]